MIKKLFPLAALLLLVASCTNAIDNVENLRLRAGADSNLPVFYATIEGSGNAATKVFADDQLRVLWNADDRITVFNKYSYGYEYSFTGQDGDNAGEFAAVPNNSVVTGNALDHVYAVYPHNSATKISNDGVITATLPSQQAYKANSFGIGANTMMSVTDDTQLRFKNVGGYLSFKFYGNNVSVKRITLKGNNHEKLAGKASITMALGGTPTVEMQEDATESITLTCETPVTVGTTAENPTEFWFVLPPTTFMKGFTVTVTDSHGRYFEKSTSGFVTISRNNLSHMSAMKVIMVKDNVPPDDEIWYVTYNNEKVYGVSDASFNQSIISNTYVDGKGVIKLSGALSIVKTCAFNNSFNLKQIYLPDCVEQFEDQAFLGGEIETFYIPANLQQYSGQAFAGCIVRNFKGDKRVQNNGIIVAENGHIRLIAASGESTLTIPGTYDAIDSYALWAKNPELKHLIIEDGITSIGMYAFSGCDELETVRLPQTMSNPTAAVFDYCDNISKFEGPSEYVSSDGKTVYRYIPFYASDGITIISSLKWVMNIAKSGLTNYVVDDEIYGLDPESFCRAADLRSISFERNDIEILGDTFDECYNLEYISGPGSTEDHRAYIATICGVKIFELFAGKGIQSYTVTDCDWIQGNAFAYWPDLKEVTISEGVIQNGTGIFWGCPKLEKVVFPSTYESIGSLSFSSTSTVKEIWLKSLVPPIIKDYGGGKTIGLEEYKSQLSIYVPKSALSAYLNDSYWGQYNGCLKTFD